LDLRFPGQYYDAESGLNYNYFRDYNPAVGGYVEADPIGLLGGMNLLIYVDSVGEVPEPNTTNLYTGNNPINYIDTNGESRQRGERRWASQPSGTPSPFKYLRPHPTDPTKVIYTDPRTGKDVVKAKPPGYDDQKKKPKQCKAENAEGSDYLGKTLAVGAGLGAGYFLYRGGRMLPSLLPPFWWTIPANAAIP